jgi:tryptophanyl-tRNA synthetase
MNRIFSGVQPTGNLHLGNYLGAIKNWVSLQKEFECIFCIVDLHAITIKQDPKELENNTLEVTAAYLASGINPEKTIIFNQSAVSAHTELTWLLSCFTPIGWLNRMTQFKEKAGKKKDSAVLGLYSYPVLMASDILAYKATHVPVGEDQKQHLELARDIANTFNQTYKTDFFPIPEPQIFGEATRVMSLRNGKNKMSKSDESDYSRINITDTKDLISLKIQKAKTDPHPLPSEKKELENRPEAVNLLGIYSALKDEKFDDVMKEMSGKDFSSFKKLLSELTVDKIEPISKKMNDYLKNKDYLKKILEEGKKKANDISSKNLLEIKKTIGLLII